MHRFVLQQWLRLLWCDVKHALYGPGLTEYGQRSAWYSVLKLDIDLKGHLNLQATAVQTFYLPRQGDKPSF